MRLAVLGNGGFCIGFDATLCLREMFWPTVGLENHASEKPRNRLILLPGGELQEDREVLTVGIGEGFQISGHYGEGMSYIWDVRLRGTGLALKVTDIVHPYEPVWLREVAALSDVAKKHAVCFRQAFGLSENTVGESAFYDPGSKRLYHYKGRVWVGISLNGEPGVALGKVRDGGAGPLTITRGKGVAEHGLLESLLSCAALGEGASFILAFGRDREEADKRLDAALLSGFDRIRHATRTFWSGFDSVSAKVLASHCDRGGGIIASCDTGVMEDFRDHYRYVWHRDAAMCASSLLRAGLDRPAERFLSFCGDTVTSDGFFWQRYRADGTRGSGWHAGGRPGEMLPIQEDETALPLVTAGDYLSHKGDLEVLDAAYNSFISRSAKFIEKYASRDGAFVGPSHDLWEERTGVFSFTQASCVAGLCWAGEISDRLGKPDGDQFFERAFAFLRALVSELGTDDAGFARGFLGANIQTRGEADLDWTPDSALYQVPLLLGPLESTRVWDKAKRYLERAQAMSASTWRRLDTSLAVPWRGRQGPNDSPIWGVARYQGDWYARPDGAGDLPGNPWLISTAWRLLSGYRLGLLSRSDLASGSSFLERASLESGVMPEQVSCLSFEPLSVAPLAWSHASNLDILSELQKGSAHTTARISDESKPSGASGGLSPPF